MTAMNGWLRDKMRAVLSGLNRDDGIGTEPLDDDHGIPVYRHGLGYSIHAVDPFEAEAAKRGTEPLDDDGEVPVATAGMDHLAAVANRAAEIRAARNAEAAKRGTEPLDDDGEVGTVSIEISADTTQLRAALERMARAGDPWATHLEVVRRNVEAMRELETRAREAAKRADS